MIVVIEVGMRIVCVAVVVEVVRDRVRARRRIGRKVASPARPG